MNTPYNPTISEAQLGVRLVWEVCNVDFRTRPWIQQHALLTRQMISHVGCGLSDCCWMGGNRQLALRHLCNPCQHHRLRIQTFERKILDQPADRPQVYTYLVSEKREKAKETYERLGHYVSYSVQPNPST
jgi:hypothetical protein